MSKITTIHTMTLDGGTPILDLVNSGYDRQPGSVTERLEHYEDLLTLAERLQLFDTPWLERLRKESSSYPRKAEAALQRTRAAREVFYRFFIAVATQQAENIDAGTLTEINRSLGTSLSCRQLQITDRSPRFTDHFDPTDLLSPLWKIVLTAYDLLATGDLRSIRQCSGCAWLFYDHTKNQRKKWCSMASCGNSKKTKGYYARTKARR